VTTTSLAVIMGRDLAALRREVEAYPDERLLWAAVPGLSNSGGVLVRHLCGNLQHFIGTVLGGTGYVRNRDAEFGAPPDSRAMLLAEIDRTIAAVTTTLPRLTAPQLGAEYPLAIGEQRLLTEPFLIHLAVHLGFHLGQLDYHRRVVTGQSLSIAPMGLSHLAAP
jgi:hypothetical protein